MATRFRIDPLRSRFTVQGFATGPLSIFGHSPTFIIRDFAGSVGLDEQTGLDLDLSVRADALELDARVSASDRQEIEGRMRREVLETSRFPEITYRASEVASEAIDRGRYRVRLEGPLSLHGVTRAHRVEVELRFLDDGLRLVGECPLRMSDFQVRPVTALGGAIRLKDDLRFSFDLAGLPEGA